MQDPGRGPVRLIASDLDGTVLGPDFRFRPRTLEAITAARDAGIQVVFVTGRPKRWLDPLHEQLDDAGVVICSNGAVVFDPGTQRVLSANGFDVAEALPVIEDVRRAFPDSLFAAETLDAVHTDHGWARTDRMEIRDVTEAPVTETLRPGTAVVKLLAKLDGADPDTYFEAVLDVVAGRLAVTHSVAAAPLVEMGQRGLTKARTLERFAAELGISRHEVMAFGDMPNDLEMLTWAGRGYAMADGHPGVVAAVERTAPAFTEDGVAQVIERYLAGDEHDTAARTDPGSAPGHAGRTGPVAAPGHTARTDPGAAPGRAARMDPAAASGRAASAERSVPGPPASPGHRAHPGAAAPPEDEGSPAPVHDRGSDHVAHPDTAERPDKAEHPGRHGAPSPEEDHA